MSDKKREITLTVIENEDGTFNLEEGCDVIWKDAKLDHILPEIVQILLRFAKDGKE